MKIRLVVCEVKGFVMGKIEVGLEEDENLKVVVENGKVKVVVKKRIVGGRRIEA